MKYDLAELEKQRARIFNLDARFHKPAFKFQTLRSPIKSPLSARVGHFFKIKTFLRASSLSILCLKPQ